MKYFLLILVMFSRHAYSQTFAIKGDRIISGDKEILNPTIVIYKDKIIDINIKGIYPDSAQVIDLSGYSILPGLIDVHTHLLHDGGEYNDNLYNYSTSYRAIRAVSNLNTSLINGFTTVRDVCTEGAGYADVDLAKAIDKKIIVGPKVIPSTKGIAATGQYYPNPKNQNWEIELPAGTKYVSGVDECRKEVREQISRGAQWIKVFADWSVVSFTMEELLAIVNEAKRFNVNVAAHATTREGILLAIKCGAKSIEHGDQFDEALIQEAIKADVYWCPTMTVYEYYKVSSEKKYASLKNAYANGLKIVLGTDAGAFPWTINQAKELEHYVNLIKMKPIDAIKSGTMYPAQLLGKEKEIGLLNKGFTADIIAVKGNPLDDITLLQRVDFVMKGGVIIKRP
jgi:imidazolonepropionase-like amidohydrolase